MVIFRSYVKVYQRVFEFLSPQKKHEETTGLQRREPRFRSVTIENVAISQRRTSPKKKNPRELGAVLTSWRVMKDDSTWFNYVNECKKMERNVKESKMIADSKWFKCFPPKHLQSVLLQLITSHWQWWLQASNGNRRFLAPSTSIFHLIGRRSSDGIKSLYLRMLKSEAPPANQSAMLPT